MFSQKWETDPAASVEDRSTCACVAPAGAGPATETRCQPAEAAIVVIDQVTDSSVAPAIHRMPIRSVDAPAASANA
jgi:hypothetical protein